MTESNGSKTYKTRDLGFAAFLIASTKHYVILREDGSEIIKPFDPPTRVEIKRTTPIADTQNRPKNKVMIYEFEMVNADGETDDAFIQNIRRLEMHFVNKQTLIEPVDHTAWRAQLRAHMLDTDKRRPAIVAS